MPHMRRRCLATCVVVLGLTLGAALPSSAAAALPVPSHTAQQTFQRAMKGVLPESTAKAGRNLVLSRSRYRAGLVHGYSVGKMLSAAKPGKDGAPSKDTILVVMRYATATFCAQYHSEVAKVINQQPG